MLFIIVIYYTIIYISCLVFEVSINITQPEEFIIGLAHNLECTFLVPSGVSPFLVNIAWNGSMLTESSRIVVSNVTSNGSLYTRTVSFIPLLSLDSGEYTCYAEVIGFDETMLSDSLNIIATGMYT